MILPDDYAYDDNGFIKQVRHIKFPYSVEYKSKQGTNIAMSYLRLGWLSSFFKYEELSKMSLVDVGCGNGVFVKCCMEKFIKAVGYDIVGESITQEELYSNLWDLAILSDVLEHFEDIEDLFKINWNYCMLSFPETPKTDNFEDLKKWRHFKPNEHLYYLNASGVKRWLEKHDGTKVIGISNFEDLIRTRWDVSKTNISSILVRRKM